MIELVLRMLTAEQLRATLRRVRLRQNMTATKFACKFGKTQAGYVFWEKKSNNCNKLISMLLKAGVKFEDIVEVDEALLVQLQELSQALNKISNSCGEIIKHFNRLSK